ncbi:hypothetical protein ATI53_11152 [Salipiger aestuarii]|uniref:Uncharacterized protein n=1 Tax=Salipiger aestuarii TaxID=568098 RepID=A0A327XFC2_9RHOB|nr:hypothetical protein ATI53_11152 [Salipiger aestuarii]
MWMARPSEAMSGPPICANSASIAALWPTAAEHVALVSCCARGAVGRWQEPSYGRPRAPVSPVTGSRPTPWFRPMRSRIGTFSSLSLTCAKSAVLRPAAVPAPIPYQPRRELLFPAQADDRRTAAEGRLAVFRHLLRTCGLARRSSGGEQRSTGGSPDRRCAGLTGQPVMEGDIGNGAQRNRIIRGPCPCAFRSSGQACGAWRNTGPGRL